MNQTNSALQHAGSKSGKVTDRAAAHANNFQWALRNLIDKRQNSFHVFWKTFEIFKLFARFDKITIGIILNPKMILKSLIGNDQAALTKLFQSRPILMKVNFGLFKIRHYFNFSSALSTAFFILSSADEAPCFKSSHAEPVAVFIFSIFTATLC